jgi:hypothetical protein
MRRSWLAQLGGSDDDAADDDTAAAVTAMALRHDVATHSGAR